MNNSVRILKFQEQGDERGHLVIAEGNGDIPFDIKRVFYIYGTQGNVVRGQHANLDSHFVLINISGKSKVRVRDGKGYEETFVLDKPNMGLYLPNMLWKDMYDFSSDSILLVLASEHYDEHEYIRDYNEYVDIVHR